MLKEKRQMRSFLMILLFVSSAVFAEKVYQWTDPQGNVVFSDKPHPDAKQIDVPDLPSFDTQTTNTKKTASQTTKTQTNKLVYTSLKIISPKNSEDGFVLIGDGDILSKICNGVFFKTENLGICMMGTKK
ncbi:MAG: hypothetical protein CMF49_05695 [Legionellales bacterium]|nr:hypothetical protein [Legionellales bacterium]